MFRLVVVLLLLSSVAAAQVVEVEDASGDVEYETADGGSAPVPVGAEDVDLLRVWMGDETEDTFHVGMEIAGAPPPFVVLGSQSRYYEIHFEFDGVAYKVLSGSVMVYNPGADLWRKVGDAERIEAEAGLAYSVPKQIIRDGSAHPLRVGSTVENLHGMAYYHPVSEMTGEGRFIDRAPDGNEGPSLELVLGPGDFGDLSVFSPSPQRSSNGGPDVFVFPLVLENQGAERSILLDAPDHPDSWDVHVAPVVRLPTGFTEVPVIVSTPAGHKHGETTEFNITFTDGQGTAIGRFPLSIHYLTIPQLAGHHPMLYMHTGRLMSGAVDGLLGEDPTATVSWFNTLEEDEADSGQGVESQNTRWDPLQEDSEPTDDFAEWAIPMDPALLIGMDFDLQREAEFQLAMRSNVPAQDLTVSLDLLHCRPSDASGDHAGRWGCNQGSWFRLAGGAEDGVALPSDQTKHLSFVTPPEGYADLVPYQEGSNVLMYVRAQGAGIHYDFPNMEMEILPRETFMHLPLNEFQDPVDQSFEDAGALRVTRVDDFETRANPGQVHRIHFDVDDTDAPRSMSLAVFGHNADWVDAPRSITTQAGESRFSLDVEVPEDVAVGDFAEFFVVVEPKGEDRLGALAKARVTVVEESVTPAAIDDGPGKETPAPGLAPLASLGAAWAARRRFG